MNIFDKVKFKVLMSWHYNKYYKLNKKYKNKYGSKNKAYRFIDELRRRTGFVK